MHSIIMSRGVGVARVRGLVLRVAALLLGAMVCLSAAACRMEGSECTVTGGGIVSPGGDGGSGGVGGEGGGGAGGGGVGGEGGSAMTPDASPSDATTGGCASSTDCNDGNACTLDYCMSGICSNPTDTMFSVCGEMGLGHCFRTLCCEGCIDLKAVACVQACPLSQVCSPLGVCVD